MMRTRRGVRPAFTLIEMVLSLSITAILMGGIAVSLSLAGRTVNTGAEAETPALDSAKALRDLTADLSMALAFIERTDHAVEFTVPDRDGDEEVDLLRYEWSGTVGDPLERWINGDGPVTVAHDVHALDFSYLVETRGAPPPPAETQSPELELFAHDDDPGGQAIPDRYAAEIALLESWGYTVTPIDASAPQGDFDSAALDASVAIIPPGTDESMLGTKLRGASIGVVNEEASLSTEMGLSDAPAVVIEELEKIKILKDDYPHYITDALSNGDRVMVDPKQSLVGYPGIGAGTFHAKQRDNPKDPALVVLDAGASLEGPGGGTAAARRVFMPWGDATFDHGALATDGLTLFRRAVEWAENGIVGSSVLFVVEGLGSGLGSVELVKREGPAMCLPPLDLPSNAVGWSITRILVVASAHGPDLDGKFDIALTIPAPDQTPSTLDLWGVEQHLETLLPATPTWFEFTVGISNLDPEQGICLQIVGRRTENEKRDSVLGFEANDAFLEPGPVWTTTDDQGDTWSAPVTDRRLRLYVYGTYTTIGPPVW